MSVLLCSIITQNLWLTKVHIISNIRCWKTRPWQRQNSLDVYNWLIKSFPNIEFQRHENFIAPDLEWGSKGPNIVDEYGKLKAVIKIELRAHAEYVAHKEKLDAWYCGVTQNPDKEFDERLADRDVVIDSLSDKTLGQTHQTTHGRLCLSPIHIRKERLDSCSI